MKALLDTHALLWWFTDDLRLSSNARAIIGNAESQIFVSAASAWEIATKHRLGKLNLIPEITEKYTELVAVNDFSHLAISHSHCLRAGNYDWAHRDPFDRMLAAQSELEDLPLITKDAAFNGTNTTVIW